MKTEWTIEELSTQTGIPRRTIHFYVQQGILPPPTGAGLGARYSMSHLQRLQAVPVLRKTGLRLDEIRERFSDLTLEELSQIISDQPDQNEAGVRPAPSRTSYRIAEAAPVWDIAPPIPAPSLSADAAAEQYLHYSLPGGLILMVPGPAVQQYGPRIVDVILAARKILDRSDDHN